VTVQAQRAFAFRFGRISRGMEPDDIGVVMSRASELHASICDAIDRVAQSRFSGNGSLDVFADEEDEVPESSTEGEVRSLEGIREALEVLETQLESLQVGCSHCPFSGVWFLGFRAWAWKPRRV
jgi:hypothetical protein